MKGSELFKADIDITFCKGCTPVYGVTGGLECSLPYVDSDTGYNQKGNLYDTAECPCYKIDEFSDALCPAGSVTQWFAEGTTPANSPTLLWTMYPASKGGQPSGNADQAGFYREEFKIGTMTYTAEQANCVYGFWLFHNKPEMQAGALGANVKVRAEIAHTCFVIFF